VTKLYSASPRVAIACGGTGGHFFPGVAVGEALKEMGAKVMLLISPKKIDRLAAQAMDGYEIQEIPAVAFSSRSPMTFLHGFWHALKSTSDAYKEKPPNAVLAMGGFTSAAPIVLGKRYGVATFLHESNAIPGRANRLLAPLVDEIFIGLEAARNRFLNTSATVTGTPVRSEFTDLNKTACRIRLGLDVRRSVLLIMGGSQGARGVNELLLAALPSLKRIRPDLQLLHLAGKGEMERVRRVYERAKMEVTIHEFLADMPAALGAADVAVSRAGASSLAELAAARLPALLLPYPLAADDHQRHNARGFMAAGGAVVMEQTESPERLVCFIERVFEKSQDMRMSLARLDTSGAAGRVAARVLAGCSSTRQNLKLMAALA